MCFLEFWLWTVSKCNISPEYFPKFSRTSGQKYKTKVVYTPRELDIRYLLDILTRILLLHFCDFYWITTWKVNRILLKKIFFSELIIVEVFKKQYYVLWKNICFSLIIRSYRTHRSESWFLTIYHCLQIYFATHRTVRSVTHPMLWPTPTARSP